MFVFLEYDALNFIQMCSLSGDWSGSECTRTQYDAIDPGAWETVIDASGRGTLDAR